MTRKVSTLGMKREEWLDCRKKGIGGSDAGAICGLNPYSSPMSVYYDKTQEDISDYDNEAMRQGRDLEDYVATRFMEATGKKVRRSNMMYWSTENPFMYANVDRLVVGENAGLECKTASVYNADKWKDGKIPEHYQIQCHHYMAVTGMKAWYIAVVILGGQFMWQKIERDEEIIHDLIQVEEAFWNQHVLTGTMPPADGTGISDEIIKKYYPSSNRQIISLPEHFNEALQRREELQNLMERIEQEQKQIDQNVKLFLQENEAAVNEQYKVSWNEVESTRLDTKRLRQEKPEIYQSYANVSHSRRFTVKAA